MSRIRDGTCIRFRTPRLFVPFVVLLVVVVVAPHSAPATAEWGDDVERGAGVELVDWIVPDLAAIVRAAPTQREALIDEFVESKAVDAIEAVKRLRDESLRPLFHALLRHRDWHVVHRALCALERCDDGSALPRALDLLTHAEVRLREKAAIACLTLWDRPGAIPPATASALVAARLARETDVHVRACLELLSRRVAGERVVDRLAEEVRVIGPEGLAWTPFLRKMETATAVAPDARRNPVARDGHVSAATLPVAPRWTTPMLGYGRETVPAGRRLQPFGFRRNGGTTVHTGRDVGALLDGAGLYACADGVVRFIHTGSDMGTLIVTEHRVSEHELATVVYMHAASVAFVRAGERVSAGQLMGSLGLGFSFENGGHFSHLHLGMAQGPFDQSHCHGYESAGLGLAGWHDPAVVLADWIDRTRAPLDDLEGIPLAFAGVAAAIRAGRYAAALDEVNESLTTTSLDIALRTEAARLRGAIEAAGPSVVARAIARRAKGDPIGTRALLTRDAARLAGLPGGNGPARLAAEWDADATFAEGFRKARQPSDASAAR